jgi:hypothetical protein
MFRSGLSILVKQKRYSLFTALLCLLLVIQSLGCSTFEDEYTGSYRQSSPSDGLPAIQVDLFRFGDHSSAFIRLFDEDPVTGEPFGEEITCLQTKSGPFRDNRQFDLVVQPTFQFPTFRLIGEIKTDGKLEAKFFSPDEGARVQLRRDQLVPAEEKSPVTLTRDSLQPSRDCQAAPGAELQFTFPRNAETEAPQSLPETTQPIESPSIVLWWTGRTVATTANGNEFISRIDEIQKATSLEQIIEESNQITRSPLADVSVPPERLLTETGDTRYGIAHIFVADLRDATTDIQGRDTFITGTNRIIGTALRRVRHADCPTGTKFWGPFILFIEGNPKQIAEPLTQALEDGEDSRLLDDFPKNQHFFVLNACATEEQILEIQVPSELTRRQVLLYLTGEYLHAPTWPIPRIRTAL